MKILVIDARGAKGLNSIVRLQVVYPDPLDRVTRSDLAPGSADERVYWLIGRGKVKMQKTEFWRHLIYKVLDLLKM